MSPCENFVMSKHKRVSFTKTVRELKKSTGRSVAEAPEGVASSGSVAEALEGVASFGRVAEAQEGLCRPEASLKL